MTKILYLILAIAFLSCTSSNNKDVEEQESMAKEEEPTSTITLEKITGSPEYSESSLQLNSPSETALDTGIVQFDFAVTNYELGSQTADAENKGLANSGKGQHIHLIVDNGPYSAHYEPKFDKELAEGHHVLLAFLSRSYHESVKNENSFIVKELTIGNPTEHSEIDLEAPHLFYSRPKGSYAGLDTKNLLLDFYLLNVDLSPEGHKVRANINGEEFIIEEWAPYKINGLSLGEVSVKLELLDSNGDNVPGPFNTVERTVTLTE